MKCQYCGSDLEEGVLFCRDCGNRVAKKKLLCRACGANLLEGAKFCSNCGTNVNNGEIPVQKASVYAQQEDAQMGKDSLGDKINTRAIKIWNSMDIFCKIVAIAFAFVILLSFISMLNHNGFAMIFSVLQIAGLVIATLMHKEVIKSPKKYLKYVILTVAAIFTVLNVMSYAWEATPSTSSTFLQTNNETESTVEEIGQINTITNNLDGPRIEQTITKGSEYAYMTDEWNVYIARAVSDDIIKIENWNKTSSSEKSVSFDYNVGTFKINDSEHNFSWIDKEHTAFFVTFKDENNSAFKNGGTAAFTININDSDKNKGSNYSEKIACYFFQNDDWHLYRAIPLTDTLIKIETWYRGSSSGTFLFGYDGFLIDTTSENTDFEWTDEEHRSFSITMNDSQNNSYWKNDTFVVFELENEDYTYSDVKSYLSIWEVGEGEAAAPASSFDFKYENYEDVQKELESAGFTNITTKILYDIVWGWTSEGEVDSVSIDERIDYETGEVFKRDVPIVITYHMEEEKDPSKISMPDSSTSYIGKNYKAVEKTFKDLGFTNIVIESKSISDTSYADGEVYSVKAAYGSFEKGSTYAPDDKITIRYYVVDFPEVVETITVENNLEFASLMKITDQTDAVTIRAFVDSHIGSIVEFDGCVAFMMHHEDYKTRFDICMAGVDYYADRVYGPLFAFEDVSFYDMNVSGTDTVAEKMNFRITGQIKGYNSEGGYIVLKPVSMKTR